MRDKIVWFLATTILRLGSKWYKERLQFTTNLGLFVQRDPELLELALDRAKNI